MPKSRIVTIPNLLSFFRILLIPIFAILYFKTQDRIALWPIIILVISGLTDMLDGLIARKFHQVSDLGKILDPIADKLTQITVVACLAIRFRQLWVLLGIYIIKELAILIGGISMLKSKKVVPSARWFGKVATFEFYCAMALLLVFPDMNIIYVDFIIIITTALVIFSLVMYAIHFFNLITKKGKANDLQ